MAIYFTSDWHLDDENTPGSYRSQPTRKLAEGWMEDCHRTIHKDDTLCLLGDMASTLEGWKFYDNLPDCALHVMFGECEDGIANFAEKIPEILVRHSDRLTLSGYHSSEVDFTRIGNEYWRMSYYPTQLLGFATAMPSVCGYVHGIWRTQCLPNGMLIINVGIDAWHQLVSEDYLRLEKHAIDEGYYDCNVRVDLWHQIDPLEGIGECNVEQPNACI